MGRKLRRAVFPSLLVVLAGTCTQGYPSAGGSAITSGQRNRPAQSSAPTPGSSSSPTPSAATPGSQQVGVVDKVASGGVIRGRVRLAPANLPLRNVRITMRGAPGVRDLAIATTDEEGYFELSDLRPGEYRLLATRAGFVMSEEDRGASDPMSAGRKVVVADGARVDDVEFVLLPGAVIAGQIFDATGEPLTGAVVHVHREQFHDGKPWPHPDAVAIDLTDDFGRFRLFGLPPGNYFVSARATAGVPTNGPSGGGALALGATFFPGTTVGGDGRVFQLQAGEEVGGIAFAVVPAPDTMPARATASSVAPSTAVARPATIRGRVVRQGDGATVSGAEVLLRTATGASVVGRTLTDAGGRYEFPGLEPGAYTVAASRRGYAPLQFGQRRPGDPAERIAVESGEVIDGIALALPGGGALEGRVIDGRGEPVAGAIVRVLRQEWVRGRQQPVVVPAAPDRTDDRGAFRVHSLAPGTYFLSAIIQTLVEVPTSSWSAPGGGFMTLFPGTASIGEAQPISIGSAEEVAGLIITAADVRPFKVSGFVEDESGRRIRSPLVTLIQRPQTVGGESTHGGSGAADGTFTFNAVFPGEYTIAASPSQLSDRVAYQQIVVTDTDLVVPIVLRRASTFAGRIAFESETDRKALVPQAVSVHLDPLEPNQVFRGSLDMIPRNDWSFEVRGLVGLRRLRVAVPNGWAVRSARVGNSDIMDVPLDFSGADVAGVEIELTRRVQEVAGRVVDARGEPVPHAVVVLFAEDRQRRGPDSRFVASARADRLGRFSHRGLPPERYLAAAALDIEPGEETNPALLDRLQERAPARFSLNEGAAQRIDVPLLDAR